MFGISTSLTLCKRSMLLAGVVLLSSCSSASLPSTQASPAPTAALPAPIGLLQLIAQGSVVPNCPPPASGHAACGSFLMANPGTGTLSSHRRTQTATVNPSVNMLTPSDLQAAYGLTQASASMGSGRTVGVVVAYDISSVESDLAVYRSAFGLSACTTANGCFRKTDQQGGTNYPAQDFGWGSEMTLDVAMISALCPNCHILLVEANSNSFSDLAASVNMAVNLGASVVNNSYGTLETGMGAYAASYNHPGIPIVAAAGNGNGTQGFTGVQNVPAAYSTVIAVGMTYLQPDTSNARGSDEYAYLNSSSGCSTLVSKPSWQHDSACSTRTVADISFTGACGQKPFLEFYYSGVNGWAATCGSSGPTAAVSAIAGLAGTVANDASFLYANASSLLNITAGSNSATFAAAGSCTTSSSSASGVSYFSNLRRGMSSSPNYLCNAQVGYNAPTGLGVPNGPTAFITSATPAPTPTPCVIQQGAGTPAPHQTQNPNQIGNGCTS
jgi:subtilase family serine protease